MRRADALRRLGVVAVVALVVVAASVALAFLPLVGPRDVETPYPNTSEMLPARAAAQGDVQVDSTDESGVVLVDDAHANRFSPDEVRPLLSAVSEAGYEVKFLDIDDDFDRRLSEADAFVVVDPGAEYSAADASRVQSFVADGGRLVVLGEPTRTSIQAGPLGATVIKQRSRLGTLGSAVGVEFGTEYLYNLGENEGNFKRVFATGEPGRTALYTATRVSARNGSRLLTATEGTRLSGSAAPGSYPVAVTRGNVLAVGDTTFLAGGKHTVADNERLVEHIVTFLVSGERRRGVRDYPYVVGRDASVRYTSAALLNGTQTLTQSLHEAGRTPTVRQGSPSPDDTDVLVATYGSLRSDDAGSGIDVSFGDVTVEGHTAPRDEVAVAYVPDSGYDLVVAAPDGKTAERIAGTLANGEVDGYALTDRLALVPVNATTTSSGSAGGSAGSGQGPGPGPGPGPGHGPGIPPGPGY